MTYDHIAKSLVFFKKKWLVPILPDWHVSPRFTKLHSDWSAWITCSLREVHFENVAFVGEASGTGKKLWLNFVSTSDRLDSIRSSNFSLCSKWNTIWKDGWYRHFEAFPWRSNKSQGLQNFGNSWWWIFVELRLRIAEIGFIVECVWSLA